MVILPLLLVACVPHLYSPVDTAEPDDQPWSWQAPENSWPANAPPIGLEAEGLAEGQVAPDFRMLDQFGDTVSLWQFYGYVIVVDFSTLWCGPCQQLAQTVEETWQAYQAQDFIYLTVLSQDLVKDVPDVDELASWANAFGITAPVLSDGEEYTEQVVTDDSFPRVLIINRSMVVLESEVSPLEDSTIRALVEQVL